MTQVRGRRHPALHRTSLICLRDGGGRSDKGQGLSVIRRPFCPALAPARTEAVQGPGADDHGPKSLGLSFSYSQVRMWVKSDTQHAAVHHMGSLWGGEREEEGRDGQRRGSGEVQGRFFSTSLTLQESQIASGSRYPPCTVQCWCLSHLLVVLPLSSHSSSRLYLFCASLLIFPPSVP